MVRASQFDFEIVDIDQVPRPAYQRQKRTEERLQMIESLPPGKVAKVTLRSREEAIRLRNSFRALAARYWGAGKLHTRVVVNDATGRAELYLWRGHGDKAAE